MITLDRLISPAYLDLQKHLHKKRAYGERGHKWAGIVLQLSIEHQCASVLDYGCGEGTLAAALRTQPLNGFQIAEYDPAMPGKDALPAAADLVNVTDVLEHIEEDRLDLVLKHIRQLAKKAVWCVIATRASEHILKDGRNAHLTVRPAGWWKHRLIDAGFRLVNPPTIVRKRPEKEWSTVLLP